MLITLKGFRCHTETVFNFVDGSLTLLKGPSGAGKSTILQAVYWCLYGSLRNIYNRSTSVKKCQVTLDFPTFTVMRQGGPNLLQVTLSNTGITYEDAEAQNIIENSFGNKEMWKACCYIDQGNRCALLVGSNNDRMDLLNRLSFSQDNPKDVIAKIDAKLKEYNYDYRTVQVQHQTEIGIFSQQMAARPFQSEDILTPEQLQLLRNELADTITKKTEFNRINMEQQRLRGVHSTLSSNLTKVTTQLNEIRQHKSDHSLDELTKMMEEAQNKVNAYHQLMQQQSRVKQGQQLKTKLETDINALLTSMAINPDDPMLSTSVSPTLIGEAQQLEREYTKSKSLSDKYGLLYDQKIISDSITDTTTLLEQTNSLKAKKETLFRIQTLEKQVTDLNLSEEITDEQINQAKDNYNKLKQSVDILTCPHCSQPVRIAQMEGKNSLILGDSQPVTQEQLNTALSQVTTLYSQWEKTKQVKTLKTQIGELLITLGENIDRTQLETSSIDNSTDLRNKLNDLHSIKIVTLPVILSQHLTGISQYQQWSSQLKDLNTFLDTFKDVITSQETPIDPSQELATLKNKYSAKLLSDSQEKTLSDEQQRIQAQLNDIILLPDIDQQVLITEQRELSLKQQIERVEYAQGMMQKHTDLTSKKDQVDLMHKRLTDLIKFKQKAIDVECQQLQVTVDSINAAMNEVLGIVFEEPIRVILGLHKALKSDKNRLKQVINLSIDYRGANYDNISFMSGGEGDRISFALITALNRLSSCPLLLLDESLTSLNEHLRELCLDALRTSVCGTKTVICVNHEDVEGHYDDIVTV